MYVERKKKVHESNVFEHEELGVLVSLTLILTSSPNFAVRSAYQSIANLCFVSLISLKPLIWERINWTVAKNLSRDEVNM